MLSKAEWGDAAAGRGARSDAQRALLRRNRSATGGAFVGAVCRVAACRGHRIVLIEISFRRMDKTKGRIIVRGRGICSGV